MPCFTLHYLLLKAMKEKHNHNSTVFIVDDDDSLREALSWLMGTVEIRTRAFATAQAFLEEYEPCSPACMLLDLRMPGMGGLGLQKEMVARGIDLPIIFLTSHGDVQTSVQAMKAGAVDFIEKPFNNQLLLELVQKVLVQQNSQPSTTTQPFQSIEDLSQLTQRENEVLRELVMGKTNKATANDLDISIKTVEFHRKNLMRKLGARSLADLVLFVHK